MKLHSFRAWVILAPLMAALALLAAACGDDDSGGSTSSGGGGGTGSDEKYVAAICDATVKFSDNLEKSTKDLTKIKSEADAAKLFVEPLEQYVKDMKSANPPKDVKEYHDGVVKALSDALTAFKQENDVEALASVGDGLPEPPQAVKDRLKALADKNEDCKKAGFDF